VVPPRSENERFIFNDEGSEATIQSESHKDDIDSPTEINRPTAPESELGDVDEINSSTSDASMNSNRRERRKGQTVPELKMTERERQKREQMDRSSDDLIIPLNSEQSDVEKLNMLRDLRELQKQEIIIEV
jgi:hypothetical protein